MFLQQAQDKLPACVAVDLTADGPKILDHTSLINNQTDWGTKSVVLILNEVGIGIKSHHHVDSRIHVTLVKGHLGSPVRRWPVNNFFGR